MGLRRPSQQYHRAQWALLHRAPCLPSGGDIFFGVRMSPLRQGSRLGYEPRRRCESGACVRVLDSSQRRGERRTVLEKPRACSLMFLSASESRSVVRVMWFDARRQRRANAEPPRCLQACVRARNQYSGLQGRRIALNVPADVFPRSFSLSMVGIVWQGGCPRVRCAAGAVMAWCCEYAGCWRRTLAGSASVCHLVLVAVQNHGPFWSASWTCPAWSLATA